MNSIAAVYKSEEVFMEKTIEEVIYEETEKRLAIMAADDYEFPKEMNKTDLIAIMSSIGICAILMLLCMTGVIQ